MSYSIIFETKIVELTDGRLLYLDRSGCNNDDSGRTLDDFRGEIYTEEKFKERAESFMKEKSEYWELKIGSKCVTYYDYGKHLLRMRDRAKKYNDFIKERYFSAKRYDGVELIEPEEKTLTAEEFDEIFYKLLYSGNKLSYRRLTTRLKTEEEIINALDNKQPVSFYVGKKYKTM
jgi:hypothetical protein